MRRITGALTIAALCALGSACGNAADRETVPPPRATPTTTTTAAPTTTTEPTTTQPTTTPVTPAPVPPAAPAAPVNPPAPQPPVTPKPQPAPRTTTAKPAAPPPAVYYANCSAAKAAGAAPIYRGEPGYRPALDRDNDGIACE